MRAGIHRLRDGTGTGDDGAAHTSRPSGGGLIECE
jgi:hypothetical protein